MGKVTSKLQLTVPKAIAVQYGIRPGDELQWTPSGDSIRIELAGGRSAAASLSIEERLDLFDKGSERLNRLQGQVARTSHGKREGRGWNREDLYYRGLPR